MNLFTENLKNRFMLKQCIKLKFREIMPLSLSLSLFGIADCFFQVTNQQIMVSLCSIILILITERFSTA